MKSLIIAEKPSLAREILNMLQTSEKEVFKSKGDYWESDNYILSSFFGHLLQRSMPQAYDDKYKSWNMDDLPIIPSKFIFQYSKGARERGELLKKLSANCGTIINATDPDREGEGIFRIWYNYENISNPTKRLWATSLTLKDLTKAWNNIEPGANYDNLAKAQELRAESDWLVGMNASRAYSIVSGGEVMPVGRVKTATLALIVQRDNEVENYKESYSYSLTGGWDNLNMTFIEDKEVKFENKSKLEQLKELIKNDLFSLKDFSKEQKKQNPPKTFSQPDLQKEANKQFGFSLDKTLQLTQSLYEKKLVTYPRTDSPYLPESDLNEYYKLVDILGTDIEKNLLLDNNAKPASVKNTNASHTAIIPTGTTPNNLSEDETKLYELIRKRFVGAFMKPKIYDQYTVFISNGTNDFRSIVNNVLDKGFTLISTEEKDEDIDEFEIDENKLRSISDSLKDLKVNAIKKAKPKYYTPATLLTAMMNVGKNSEDKESQEILKEVEGLGTAATRQTFPKELVKDGYIYEKGSSLISSPKGRSLIKLIIPELKTPELTAQWELKLREVEAGNYDYYQYKNEIEAFTKHIVVIPDSTKEALEKDVNSYSLLCPKCNSKLRQFPKGIGCSDKDCDFVIWSIIFGKKLTSNQVQKLLTKGTTGEIKGFQNKEKKEFSAALGFDENYKVIPLFPEKKEIEQKCLCGGEIKESKLSYNCQSCSAVVFKVIAKRELPEAAILSLFAGKTIFVKNMKSKAGKSFTAKLKIGEDKNVEFLF